MSIKRLFLILTAALVFFAIDFFSKFIVQQNLPLINDYPSYPFGGIGITQNFHGITFSLVHAINHGAAWSLFSSYPHLLLSVRLIVILGVLFALIFSKAYRNYATALIFIIVAALGNVVDFFIYGHVIDLFYFIFWGYSYPIFNVADSVIFCSMAWILLSSLMKKKNIKDGILHERS